MQGSLSTLSLEPRRQPRPGNVPVTCIGMSAGGLEPLKMIFRELPAESGMAFIVVHHIRNVPTLLPEILKACTHMPVELALAGRIVQPNHVYVLPSGKEVTLADSFFSVRSRSKPRGFSNVLTVLLESVAKSSHQSVAVVLSGVDADGAAALRAFRQHGGIVIAQEPDSAERPGMPAAAIHTGVVDHVLPPKSIPGRLEEIAREFSSFSR